MSEEWVLVDICIDDFVIVISGSYAIRLYKCAEGEHTFRCTKSDAKELNRYITSVSNTLEKDGGEPQ